MEYNNESLSLEKIGNNKILQRKIKSKEINSSNSKDNKN